MTTLVYRPLSMRIADSMRTCLACLGLLALGAAAAKAPWGDYLGQGVSRWVPASIVAQRPPSVRQLPLCAQIQTDQTIRPDQDALMERTFQAILEVESRDGRDPRCWTELPTGELGPAQMMKSRVDDVNRILGERRYIYEDRLNRTKCREMFGVSCRHYWPEGGPEQWARHWNGSPTRGPGQRATEGYWQRVQQTMDGGL